MAVYPNGRYLSVVAGRQFGGATAAVGGAGAGFDTVQRTQRGARLNRFVGEPYLHNASTPDGYGMAAMVPPRTAGSMSALTRAITLTGSGSLLQGGPMIGSGSISLTSAPASLSLIVALAGSGSLTLAAAAASLSLVSSLSGTGSITLTGSGSLSMIVPFEGTGSITLTGIGDLKGNLSMEGSWTPFSTLSPENLAAAVWGASAASNNSAGTMGQKLNAASSAGDPWGTALPGTYPPGTAGAILGAVVSGLSPTQAGQLFDIFRRLGLDPAAPLITDENNGSITAGSLSQTVVEAPEGVVTVTRQP